MIDADLIGRNSHRFPNLACMKISGFYKSKGYDVDLITDYSEIDNYKKVFISKVFSDTPIDESILSLENVEYGGTGFYYEKSPDLPIEIEHHMPDYELYLPWVEDQIKLGVKKNKFDLYLNYSIGFTTRGCFRKCDFCVNKKYDGVKAHSPVNEFYDPKRKYICLLDDNILAYGGWEDILNDLIKTNKYFQYKQGMDIRLMTNKKVDVLSKSKYKGDYIFAFDYLKDRDQIEEKLTMWKSKVKKTTKLYVLTAYESQCEKDIVNAFERIKILMKHKCLPYIMRHEMYKDSKWRGVYITMARWCNQPSMFKKKSFREFCEMRGDSKRYMDEFESVFPGIANEYFDLKFEEQ